MTRYAALGRDAAGLDAAVGILDAARAGRCARHHAGGRGRSSDSGRAGGGRGRGGPHRDRGSHVRLDYPGTSSDAASHVFVLGGDELVRDVRTPV